MKSLNTPAIADEPVAIRRRHLVLPNGEVSFYVGDGTPRRPKDPWEYQPYSKELEEHWRESAELFRGDAARGTRTEVEVLYAAPTPPAPEKD